jgi:hypothetical protein
LLEAPRIDDRRVARRIDARGDSRVDLAERDFVADRQSRFETGAAGALQVHAGRLRGQAAAEHRFAREVPLARVLHDGARRDVAQTSSLQPESFHDCAQRRGEHFLIADIGINAIAAGKWNARPTDDGNAPWT